MRLLMILVLVISAALTGCSRGDSLVPPRETLFLDILGEMGHAVVDDTDFVGKFRAVSAYPKLYRDPRSTDSLRILKVGFDIDERKKFQNMRRSLYLGAHEKSSCTVSIPLDISEGSGLEFCFSIGGYDLPPVSRFSFEMILSGGKRKIILLDTGTTAGAVPERQWRDYRISLPDAGLSGAVLRLIFRNDSKRPAHLFVANPRIYRKTDAAHKRPNIVFISVDALRADAVDAIVKKYGLTPNMDGLARDGLSFSNHFVVSNWTRPSTIAMLSSALASGTGVNIFYPPVSDGEKDYFYRRSGVRPITSIVKESGYITRSIGNNAFIIDYTGIGVDLDFDELSEYQTQWEDTMDITAEAVSWLEGNRDRNFFLFINYNAPHNAYIPPEKYLAPLRKKLPGLHPWFRSYLGEVAYTDDYLGRLMSALKRMDLYDNTIIVLTSDHGEIFSASHEMSPYTDVKAVFSHGQTQLDEELRVPLIIKPASGSAYENRRIAAQVSNIDIAPTVLDLMKLPVPAAYRGRSLLPLAEGKEKNERVVYCEGRMMYSVRAGGWKYAERFYGFGLRPCHWGGETVSEYCELFDLARDPTEETNLVYGNAVMAARMREILRRERFVQPSNTIVARGGAAHGSIRIDGGFFYDVRGDGKSTQLKRINRKRYEFTLQENASLVFETIPADAPVTITTDGGTRVLSGPFLLPVSRALGRGEYVVDASIKAVQGRPRDEVLALAGRGVCFWSEPPDTGLRGVKSEKYLSKDINRLLQKWGYIQGKEKKAE